MASGLYRSGGRRLADGAAVRADGVAKVGEDDIGKVFSSKVAKLQVAGSMPMHLARDEAFRNYRRSVADFVHNPFTCNTQP
jgi:hypothetical protein